MILWRFIWSHKTNKRYLWIAASIIVGLWTLFKQLYPYPTLVLDSYYYAEAAVLNLPVNAWPIGYSKFLQLFNLISHSGNLLVTIQYLLVELSCLVFFFTWLFLFMPGRFTRNLLFALLFVNPLFLYCSNLILSDAVFIGLSILWVTQLLWIIYHPRLYMILSSALLLTIAFAVRYNALYYPFVGALAFILSRQRTILKLAGIGLPLVLLALFIGYTSIKVGAITGERQFSAFGGWKLANDALYTYAHVYKDHPQPVPRKFRSLDSLVREYFVVSGNSGDMLKTDYTYGSLFMFAQETPLVRYLFNLSGRKSYWPFIGSKDWLSVGPLYQDYGVWLIRQHPLAFARYFLWPNFIRYINPPGEVFGSTMPFVFVEAYGGEYVRKCIGLDKLAFSSSSITLSQDILYWYPKLVTTIHLAFLIGLIGFLATRGFRRTEKPYSYCLMTIIALWGCDLCFSVLSAGVVLRYEIFILIPEMTFGLHFIEYTYRHLDSRDPMTTKLKNSQPDNLFDPPDHSSIRNL